MYRIADCYWELSDRQLWELCFAGDVDAGLALLARCAGKPPMGCPANMPIAAFWADVLAGRLGPPDEPQTDHGMGPIPLGALA